MRQKVIHVTIAILKILCPIAQINKFLIEI